MSHDHDIQRGWESDPLREAWDGWPDMRFVIGHIAEAVVTRTGADGPAGRLLEVAAAEAVHACKLAKAGFETFVLEPSPAMLERARGWMAHYGVELTLIRGICEKLPFADQSFAHVLCDSAVDHFASPDRGIREMARVLRPGGTLIVSFVNYGGLTARASRMLYRLERALRPRARAEARFWDSPVPAEHVIECTVPLLDGMCRQYLEHVETFGISLGWGFPGWGPLLGRLPEARVGHWLRRLDRFARKNPVHADFVVSVWRRREGQPRISPAAADPPAPDFDGGRPPIPVETLDVTPGDPLYQDALTREQGFPHDWVVDVDPQLTAAWERFANVGITGAPHRSWLDTVIARGPFGEAALLGVDGTTHAARWMQARASRRLDVLDVTQRQLDRVVTAVAAANGDLTGLRAIRTDLNFVRLPAAGYDVIVTSGTLHHLYNLEHVLDEVHRALRPAGLFVLHDFVGERRHRYSDHRLAVTNRLLADLPDVYKLDPRRGVEPGHPYFMSPFCGLRSEETIPLVHARFEVLSEKRFGYLAPVAMMLDMRRVEQDAPALIERLHAAEATAATDPELRPFGVFLVARR